MSLTEDQKKRAEASRQKALALRASRQQTNAAGCAPVGTVPNVTNRVPLNANAIMSSSARAPDTFQSNRQNYVSNKCATKSPPFFQQKRPLNGPTFARGKSCFQNVPTYAKKMNPSAGGPSMSGSAAKPIPTTSSDQVVVKCVLMSRQRFMVDFRYCPPVIEVLKSMSTRQYDVQTKIWSFDLKEYRNLETQLKNLKIAIVLEPLPASIVKTFCDQLKGSTAMCKDAPDADLSMVDSKLVSTLLTFQRQGVNFAIRQKGRILIADDMGLGKTLQALCIAAYYRSEWPLLIIAPSSVRFAWRQQIHEWLPSVNPQDINMVSSGKDCCTSGQVNILSYDLMARCHKQLEDSHIRVIIIDESHFLKNMKSVRAKRALPILKKAGRVILLSGTPAMSRPSELYSQLVAVDPVTFRSFHEYGLRYCDAKQLPWGWDYSGSSNLSELQLLMEERVMISFWHHFVSALNAESFSGGICDSKGIFDYFTGAMLLRMKQDVMGQLPPKRRTMIILDPSSVQLNKTMTSSQSLVEESRGHTRKMALLDYFHATGTAKINAVTEYVLDLLEADRKFLLFAHHQEILEAVEETVKTHKFKYVRIDGKTTAEKRGLFCNRFQSDADVKIAILSITAANSGINLTAASLVVFAELFWNPGILMQAEDRAHRIGQLDSVNVYYLVARNTADDYIWPLIQDKLYVLGRAGLSKDSMGDTVTDIVKDKKQRDLLMYFKESFVEELTESLEDGSAVTNAGEGSLANESHAQTSRTSEKDGAPTLAGKPEVVEDSDDTIDWSDDDTATWLDDNKLAMNQSDDLNNNDENCAVSGQPSPKKSKLT